jgi:arsenical pump membrane protein
MQEDLLSENGSDPDEASVASLPESSRRPWLKSVLIIVSFAVANLLDVLAGHSDTMLPPLLGIAVVITCAIYPFALSSGPYTFNLDMKTMPVLTLILLVLGGMPPRLLWEAPIGTPILCPLKVLLIFYGMAYICLSVNETGLLKLIAQRAATKTDSANRMFLFVGVITAAFTLVASNDIVILTLTPIIMHICKEKGYDPYPFLYLEFVSANVWSVCLLTGNPTNVIAASAANFSFDKYLHIHVVVGIASGAAAVAALYMQFRKTLQLPQPIRRAGQRREIADLEEPEPEVEEKQLVLQRKRAYVCAARLLLLLVFACLDDLHGVPLWISVTVCLFAAVLSDFVMDLFQLDGASSSTLTASKCLPWDVFPFVLSLFIMVQALQDAGLVGICAQLASSIAFHGSTVTSFGIGYLSIFACQVLNNQPMTVLFTKILTHPGFVAGPKERLAAFSSLIVGSNLGANLTIIGALAGPMWCKVCGHDGVKISSWNFFSTMLRVTPYVATTAFAVLSVEVKLFGPHMDVFPQSQPVHAIVTDSVVPDGPETMNMHKVAAVGLMCLLCGCIGGATLTALRPLEGFIEQTGAKDYECKGLPAVSKTESRCGDQARFGCCGHSQSEEIDAEKFASEVTVER